MSLNFNQLCPKFSTTAAFVLFLQPVFAQKNFTELDKAIEAKRAALGNHLVAVVASADSIAWQKTYGDFNNKTAVPIASCSKWLTAALVMQMVDEGKLSLEDKVSQYLPVFESYGKGYITIRHCLSHLTGIQQEQRPIMKMLERKKFESLDDEVKEFARKEIAANPGNEFRYNNMGLNIAARVVEVVSKKKFEQLIRLKLFVPLGMRNTTFANLDGSAPNPSGGARSTAADYIKFLQMLLANGKFAGKQILSEASVAELRKVQVAKDQIKYAPKSAEGFTYALGSWVIEGPATVNATATSLASPGLLGTWPMVDWSRGYACLFLTKSFLGEEKAGAYVELKKVVDKQFLMGDAKR